MLAATPEWANLQEVLVTPLPLQLRRYGSDERSADMLSSLDLLDHVRAGFFQLVVLSLEPEVEKEEALAKLIGWVLEQALLRDSCSTVCVAGDSQQLEQLREAGRKKHSLVPELRR